MIKYLGSKRTLVPVLGALASACEARSAVDLFTGTTRVAQEFKRRGMQVSAVDTATYSEMLGRCFIETDASMVDDGALRELLAELDMLPGTRGYFTKTFCEDARYLRPENGMRVDAIRDALIGRETDPLYPLAMTSLLLAADRVDSTTGLQMSYLKTWAARSYKPLTLLPPSLLTGGGTMLRADALDAVTHLPHVDVAYLDPPYNQHRYFTNYHVWETLVRWDAPEAYGVARKRMDARDNPATKSAFNSRREMAAAFKAVVCGVQADAVIVSYNDESWVTPEAIMGWLREAGHEEVALISFDAKRYVGAQIGIHNKQGVKVGQVKRLRNVEHVFLAGSREHVAAMRAAVPATSRLADPTPGAGEALIADGAQDSPEIGDNGGHEQTHKT